jgi:hypothetical protein
VNDASEPLSIVCSLSPPPPEGITPELVTVQDFDE